MSQKEKEISAIAVAELKLGRSDARFSEEGANGLYLNVKQLGSRT